MEIRTFTFLGATMHTEHAASPTETDLKSWIESQTDFQLRIDFNPDNKALAYSQGHVRSIVVTELPSGAYEVTFTFSESWINDNDTRGWIPHTMESFKGVFKDLTRLRTALEHGATCDFQSESPSSWVMGIRKSDTIYWQTPTRSK